MHVYQLYMNYIYELLYVCIHKDMNTDRLDKYKAPVAESEIQKWGDPRVCWSGSIGELVSSRFRERLCYKQISCRVLENA